MCRRHQLDVQELLPVQQARGRCQPDGKLSRKILRLQIEIHAARRGGAHVRNVEARGIVWRKRL